MALFHQKHMCLKMLSSNPLLGYNTDNFLYSGDLVKEGSEVDIGRSLQGIKEQCLN